jgi:hypothetical protein
MVRGSTISSFLICLLLSLPCMAQKLVPAIRLSADEVGRAQQLVQALKNAKERSAKAEVVWEQFHQSYQAAHPDLPGLRFTEDFRFAMGRVNSSTSGLFLAATIELTADERKKLEALHREMVESEQSQTQAEHDWRDFKYQLVVDHLGNSATGGYSDVTLSTGKVVRIPAPWNGELLFTNDFKSAFPLNF